VSAPESTTARTRTPFALEGEGLALALADADVPALLPALAFLTGDTTILEPALRPVAASEVVGKAPQGGLGADAQVRARALAAATIEGWVTRGRPDAPEHDDATLLEILRYIAGPVGADQLPLMRHQLGLATSARSEAAVEFPESLHVTVIGAGMAGIAAAWHLKQRGIPFTILERNNDVGGVWHENRYPGVRLDTSNFSYSYSFAQHDGQAWQHYYSPGQLVERYCQKVSEDFGIRESIEFDTTVESATYDDDAGRWTVHVRSRDGAERDIHTSALISAVGQLNNPSYPQIPGQESFAGASWHTARWEDDVDLTGKKVAVIGTGASAFQVVGQVAPHVESMTIFQRTPPWVVPTPTYTTELPEGLQWLFSNLPWYQRWYRFAQFWGNVEGRRRFALVDPEWDQPGSVSAINDELRRALTKALEEDFADRPDLLETMTPAYPPYAKRMLRDAGSWASALKQPNVEVVTEPVTGIEPGGVATSDGHLHAADVIIYGTGFTPSQFLAGIEVYGRGGVSLHDQWRDDPKAYAGITVPNFPNFFMLFGPNTGLVVNGSIVFFIEAEVEYVMACLEWMAEDGLTSIEPTDEALDSYYERIDEAATQMAYGIPGVTNWYKSSTGRVTQNWPLSTVEFWDMTRGPDPTHYRATLGSKVAR
jgi:4-hydroxyacetophenone monooxygenase